MKRVCKNTIQIDALTICYAVTNDYHISKLKELNISDEYSPYEYILRRVEGRYYNNVYDIIVLDGVGELEPYTFGQLKFSLNNGNKESNIHNDGTFKVWISLNNETLYSDRFFFLDYIATTLGLTMHNITTLDLAIDTPFCVYNKVWKNIREKSITTILNGKKITDRDEDRPEITRIISGSLNKDKYKTLCIKQRNAIRDKTKGITVVFYDKVAEINNISHKDYILKKYNNPRKLYRTEVHLNNDDIKTFLEQNEKELTYYTFSDFSILEKMFFYYLNSVIRFKDYHNKPILWEHILGRS